MKYINYMGLARYLSEKINSSSKKGETPILEERSGVREIFHPYRTPAKVKEAELSKEERELVENLRGQYEEMLKSLIRYGISLEGVPSFEVIKTHLTPGVLREARKLEESTLVVIPPISRQAMVEAINAHKVEGQKHDTYTYELGNDNLWNGGKVETYDAWKVSIVTGVQDVKDDETIRGMNYQRAKSWVKKYKDQGVDVMNGARPYLTLMMRSLAAGKPIDKEYWTILNAKNCTETSLVAVGDWNIDQVRLSNGYPGITNDDIRARGSVRVI